MVSRWHAGSGVCLVAVLSMTLSPSAMQPAAGGTEPIAVKTADVDGLRLQYLAAGHGPAILVSSEKDETQPLGMSAMMIGMLPDQTYEVRHTTVPPGSTLFLFSDGAYEILTKEEESTLGDLLSWSPELCEFNKKVAKGISDAKPCVEVKGQWDSDLHVWGMVKNPGVLAAWLYGIISTNLVGWIITVYAISLGAPFWFGALQKIVNIRSAGDAPDEKKRINGNAK